MEQRACAPPSLAAASHPGAVPARPLPLPGVLVVAGMQFLSMGAEPTGLVSLCVHARLCPALCGPMNCSPQQALLSRGLTIQEYRTGLPFPSLGESLPTQGSNLHLLHCRRILYHLSHRFFKC